MRNGTEGRDDKGCHEEMASPQVIQKGQEVEQMEEKHNIEGKTLKKEMGTVLGCMGC